MTLEPGPLFEEEPLEPDLLRPPLSSVTVVLPLVEPVVVVTLLSSLRLPEDEPELLPEEVVFPDVVPVVMVTLLS